MAKNQNIVHQYFKKTVHGSVILVKVNPIHYTGTEIIRTSTGKTSLREIEFNEKIFDDLKAHKFEPCNPLEFNLYLSGLA